MRIRLIEEYSPLKDERWFYIERKVFGGWMHISDTGTFKRDQARAIFDRIVDTGVWDKKRTVLAEATFSPP